VPTLLLLLWLLLLLLLLLCRLLPLQLYGCLRLGGDE
jgi:hypothetical protein